MIEHYKDGTPCECDFMVRSFYKSGVLCWETPWVNNEAHGIEKFYYESGAMYRETSYVNGKKHGICKEYHESGALWQEIPYVNDKIHGIYKKYHKSGILAWKAGYKHGFPDLLSSVNYPKTKGILASICFLTICMLIWALWFPPVQARSLNTEERQKLDLYLADSNTYAKEYIKEHIRDSINCASIKNTVDSLGKVKELGVIKESYRYKDSLQSLEYYESYEQKPRINEEKMQACRKLDSEYIEACKTKAIYFVEVLQQNSYGYTPEEKEDLRKQYVKEAGIKEYKDSLRSSLYISPKVLTKPLRPVRECRWYEPSANTIWAVLIFLCIEILVSVVTLSCIKEHIEQTRKDMK
jgi:hypothetical protein